MGKTLSVTVEPDVTIKGDEATLRQLVSLLLDNAIKYGTEDSTIQLTFHTVGKNRRRFHRVYSYIVDI